MAQIALQYHPAATHECCPLCGKQTFLAEGLRLVMVANQDGVCRDCGKKHAPSLVALLDLAGVAERVGRIGRHTVFPPLASLLDLAHAAENYLNAAPKRFRQAV